MLESGIIYTWINELVSNYSNCDTISKVLGSHKKPLKVLHLEEVQTFFIVIFCGFILSLVGFWFELIYVKCQCMKNHSSKVNEFGPDDKKYPQEENEKMKKAVKDISRILRRVKNINHQRAAAYET